MTNKLALAVAIALGVLSILGIRSYVDALERRVNITGSKAPYLIFVNDLKVGQKLTPDDVTRKDFQIETIVDALRGTEVTESKLSAFLGRPLRVPVKAGQILTQSYFEQGVSGRGKSPAARLGANERLVTIPVTGISSVSGLIRPGDFVDMIATMAVPDRSGQALSVTFTVFRGKPVVATGTEVDRDVGTRTAYSSITLRVTTKEANQIIYCLHNNIRYQFTLLKEGSPRQPSSDPVVEAQLTTEPLKDLRPR